VDDDGFLRLVDRAKDMLISGGLNVYPAEIERALSGLPGIEELAVIGVADTTWGEVPMLLVPDAGAVDIDILKRKMTEELADYKRPRYLVGHGAPLPRTMSGKILKHVLRDQYRQLHEDAVSLR
jgi:fatty-acyl-CoA synthase